MLLDLSINYAVEAADELLHPLQLLLLLFLLAPESFAFHLLLLLESELQSELGLTQSFFIQSSDHPVVIPEILLLQLRARIHEVVIDNLDELLEAPIDLLGRDRAHVRLVQ